LVNHNLASVKIYELETKTMARRQKKNWQNETQKDGATTETEDTVESTNKSKGSMKDCGNNNENDTAVESGDGGMPPSNIVINKDMEENQEGSKTSVSTLTICPNVAKDGLLTVVQKSNLLNWAEECFFPGSKIITVEEAKKDEKLRDAICHAIGIHEVGWAIVGTEAIKKLRSAMSDRLSLHRKGVRSLYWGK
jgi:hypothetical protein